MKKSFLFILLVIAAVIFYVFWSTGRLPSQMTEVEPLPTLTATDNTGDIEADLDSLTITEEDEGFTEINSDLNAL